MRRDLACYIYISNTLPPTQRSVRSWEKSIFMLLQNFGGAINYGPAKEVAHMEMNAGAVLKAWLVEMRRRRENLIRDKLDLCTYFSLWDHLERGAEMKSSVIWQSYLSAEESCPCWYQILTTGRNSEETSSRVVIASLSFKHNFHR